MGNYGSQPARSSLSLGAAGLAPYGIDTEFATYISPRGAVAARAKISSDILLTNRLILTPEAELFAAQTRDFDAGLRLRYEFAREFAPYIGIVYRNQSGAIPVHDARFTVGLRLWY